MRSVRHALLAAGAAVLVVVPTVRADEASGTWTGQVYIRNNYYWETSTRVDAPNVGAQLVSPDGVQINADYLVDTITSASLGSGAQSDVHFTEVRNQGTLQVSQEFDLGEAQLRLGTLGRISDEPDYFMASVGGNAALSLNDRATVLSATCNYLHSNIGYIGRGSFGTRVGKGMMHGRNLSDRGRQGQLQTIVGAFTWNQVLSPVATLVLNYQVIHLFGDQSNPYRSAMVGSANSPEQHPTQRTRHAVSGRFAYFFPETQTAVHLMYRFYMDTWHIAAINPEVRLYQMLGPSAMIRLDYRYYNQTPSFFWSPTGAYAAMPQPIYITADKKMAPFHSHLVGAQLRVQLGFLRQTALDFLEDAWFDVSFNFWFQTSGFHNAVVSQAGITAPF